LRPYITVIVPDIDAPWIEHRYENVPAVEKSREKVPLD
jgi:hypothetical protein